MSIFRLLTAVTIPFQTGALVANAIPAGCEKKVSKTPASKIRFDTRTNAKYFPTDETRAARRHRDRYYVGRVRVCETLLAKQTATAADQIDLHAGGVAICSLAD